MPTIVKLPPLESELFDTWEKHIAANPELTNSPAEAKEKFEEAEDNYFSLMMYLTAF